MAQAYLGFKQVYVKLLDSTLDWSKSFWSHMKYQVGHFCYQFDKVWISRYVGLKVNYFCQKLVVFLFIMVVVFIHNFVLSSKLFSVVRFNISIWRFLFSISELCPKGILVFSIALRDNCLGYSN